MLALKTLLNIVEMSKLNNFILNIFPKHYPNTYMQDQNLLKKLKFGR